MALSDCVKCWETPCTCGWGYRRKTKAERIEQAAVVLGVSADELRAMIGDLVPEVHPINDVARPATS